MLSLRTTAVAATLVAVALAPATAEASRKPTRAEAKAIKRIALRACEAPGGCRYRSARVSTRSRRYAWANVVGEGFSGVLLKRSSTRTRRFRVIATQGGGIEACSHWRKKAPRSVLRDLRISGVLNSSGTVTGSCG